MLARSKMTIEEAGTLAIQYLGKIDGYQEVLGIEPEFKKEKSE